jgi:hypothetical protein
MDDIYSLMMEDDEPTAQERAAALSRVLQRQQSAGNLGMLTGDRVLAPFGQAQLRQADAGQRDLAEAGKYRLQQAMAKLRAEKPADPLLGEKRAKLEAETARLRRVPVAKPVKPPKAPDTFKMSGDLRGEFDKLPEVKNYKDVSVQFDKIRRAASQPSAAGDLSLIFAYMKMLDPGSSVREGEFANAQNATGVPGQIAAKYNQILSGERLADPQRADFINQAKNLYASHEDQYKQVAERYRGLASKNNLAPDDIVAPAATPITPAKPAAAAGAAASRNAAMDWAMDPANANDPDLPAVLKKLGL